MPPLDWLIRPIAHRGLHRAQDGIIENTASAFEAAIDANYAIETDVRTSADGQAMVFHDASLDRLTTGDGDVATLAAAELKKTPFRATGDRMQALPDLLDQVAGQVPLVIEVKSDWNDPGPLERRIATDLAEYKGHVAVMSFDPRSVKAFA
ncbi:MAG: glycerophosphodiester phosphodiesterase family protein, partial [Methyloligellaceae bacterium]